MLPVLKNTTPELLYNYCLLQLKVNSASSNFHSISSSLSFSILHIKIIYYYPLKDSKVPGSTDAFIFILLFVHKLQTEAAEEFREINLPLQFLGAPETAYSNLHVQNQANIWSCYQGYGTS